MNMTRRRGAIAFFITLGVLLVGVTIYLNINYIILHQGRVLSLILGIILFALLVAGVVLNTIFLVREVRRNERQNSFLNAVTHELKTPIASIRLYLETLQRHQVDEAQRQQFYKIMLSDSDRLLATVEQVLKAGELGQRARQLNRVLIDLEALVTECITVALERHNLPPDAIVLAPTSAPYTWAPLSITDPGLGLPANQLKRIFRRFYRVPGRDMLKIKGTGLGLFLVRNIARQHGGDATAASPGPGLGTTLTLTLPLTSPTPAPSAPAPVP